DSSSDLLEPTPIPLAVVKSLLPLMLQPAKPDCEKERLRSFAQVANRIPQSGFSPSSAGAVPSTRVSTATTSADGIPKGNGRADPDGIRKMSSPLPSSVSAAPVSASIGEAISRGKLSATCESDGATAARCKLSAVASRESPHPVAGASRKIAAHKRGRERDIRLGM